MMDAQFTWLDSYNIGVEIIDKEHQRLFRIINRLYAYRDEERDAQWTCQEGIKFFKNHATQHFDDEEAYMASIQYKGLERHKQIHKGFREGTLPALEKELEESGYSPNAEDHFLGVCAGWLIGHTITEDLSIAGKGVRRWENVLPGGELTAMKQAITQLVFEMFHLESKLISDAYGGEKFGRGIYYRFVYDNNGEEEKPEVLLALDEQILIGTVGKVLGIKTNHLDSMLVHASRYTARQIIERVLEQFPAMENYKLEQENLLSYDQFRTVLSKTNTQASLLFDSGAGYFAFCILAPHLLEDGIGTPLENGNAMSEVEKYLAKHEKETAKPTVLVVDDSAVIQQNMKQLLEADYNVSIAGSGVSAIRAIALNPPQLVLLDYEMPICDGRQTLEMMRSEAAFDDVPVIFLTGKGDVESVRQVMALQPAGYLLKKLKPEEIKKQIDLFFEKQKKKKK